MPHLNVLIKPRKRHYMQKHLYHENMRILTLVEQAMAGVEYTAAGKPIRRMKEIKKNVNDGDSNLQTE